MLFRSPRLRHVLALGPKSVVITAGDSLVFPNGLSAYRVATPFLYDAINIEGHSRLVRRLGGNLESTGFYSPASIGSLQVLGVTHVVTAVGQLPFGRLREVVPLPAASQKQIVPGSAALYIQAIDRPHSCASMTVTVGQTAAACAILVDSPVWLVPPTAEQITVSTKETVNLQIVEAPFALRPNSHADGVTTWPVPASGGLRAVPTCASVSDITSLADAISAGTLDPTAQIAVVGPCPDHEVGGAMVVAKDEQTSSRWSAPGSRVTVRSARGGYVWRAVNSYPGWTARIDGKQVPLIKAFGTFQAVYVPPGNHVITFTFFPRTTILGGAVSALTVVGCIAMWLLRRRSRPTGESSAAVAVT